MHNGIAPLCRTTFFSCCPDSSLGGTEQICVCGVIDSKAECSLRVVRAQMNNSQRVIGVRYPQMLIALAEKASVDETRVQQQLVMIL